MGEHRAGAESCSLELEGGRLVQQPCAPAAGLHIQNEQPEVASGESAEGG